ncbi:MAG: nucleotidyl transferase AbiEii/AbiGii toxin family protein [Chthoniobacter sp.]|uniref:nucleotidyl transferase AbiEii/AbiGii toxin family protein n=1 Tax=Chthoniobacter sp. TaxID=2510640 RepID=UPI0032A7F4F3
MIAEACFSEEWQTRKREELGGCDPVLLEKTIHAFAPLDALTARGLDFVFKGGTSLLLRLPRIRRLSIDADIFCQEPPEKLDRLLAEVSKMRPFSGMTEDERGDHRVPARRHLKFSYTPLDTKNPAPFVLLDVVHERNVYPHVERVPLRTAFVEGDGTLLVPTIEGLLGDKLTAFGPNTTGVALNERYTMQFMKQVFDVGELFDAAGDVGAVRAAYEQVFVAENGYRGGRFTAEQALQDSFETAYRIAQVGLAAAPKDGRCELLDAGRKQLDSHLVGVKFRREEMKTAAAKAALLATAIRAANPPDFTALRYDESKLASLKDAKFDAEFSAIGKLKAVPEAMWLWAEALRLRTSG